MIFNYSFANQPHVVWVSINTSVYYCNICSLPVKSSKKLHVMIDSPLLVIYYVAMEVHTLEKIDQRCIKETGNSNIFLSHSLCLCLKIS